ncbi:MAG: hypothetical protein NVSMB20_06400 [Bradyrhizobium sp.]
MTPLAGLRRQAQKLGPYQSLALLAVPLVFAEPLKLLALYVAGGGRWFTATGMMIGAYAASLLLVERLFKVVKPKLLILGWFALLWSWWVAGRNRLIPWRTAPAVAATQADLPEPDASSASMNIG